MRVEDADDAGLDAVRAVIRHGERLGETLGLVVHATRPDRVDVAPVLLVLRVDERVAVHLGGGGQQEACVLLLGEAERLVRAERSDLQRRNRQLLVVDGTRRRGEVKNRVDRTLHVDVRRDVLLDEHEAPVGEEVRDVVGRARPEVVHANDVVAVLEEPFAEMRADEAGAAGDEDARHACSSGAD